MRGRCTEISPNGSGPDGNEYHAAEIAIDHLARRGSVPQIFANLCGENRGMAGPASESRHQDFLAFLPLFEGADEAVNQWRGEEHEIHWVKHEGGCRGNATQAGAQRTELPRSPRAVDDDPGGRRHMPAEPGRLVTQNDDWLLQAGTVFDSDFECVSAAQLGEGLQKSKARRRTSRQDDGIDVRSSHRKCKSTDYRTARATFLAAREAFEFPA